MVVIRLSRTGAKKRPFYHVVAIDHHRARDSGNYIERLGYFNPVAKGQEIKLHLNEERVAHWIAQGAQPSDRVHSLIKLNKKLASGALSTPAKKAKRKTSTTATTQTAATDNEASTDAS